MSLSQSPTLSMEATNAGVILGTAAYMSPEQAKGRQVDKRTDIFAFGCVLYEMLSGWPAFEGENVQDILGAVLRTDPDWTRLPAETPLAIRQLLSLCLQKDIKKRRSDAADVRIDIEQSVLGPTAETPTTLAQGARLGWITAAAAVLVTIALAIPVVNHLRETPPQQPEMRVEISTPATSDPISFAISPDGRRIVFVASGDGEPRLWLRPLDAPAAQPLAGTEDARWPFWSPDSRSIAFFADGKLKRMDVEGGRPLTLASVTYSFASGSWSPDGVILFASNTSSLFSVPAAGGAVTPVTKLAPSEVSHRFPEFLPGSRKFLFYVQASGDTRGIHIGSLESPATKYLTLADQAPAFYMVPGWLLFVRQGALVAQSFDQTRAELTGNPIMLTDLLLSSVDGNTLGAVSVSATGHVAYRTAGTIVRQLTWFDRSGTALGTVGARDTSNLGNPEISPDGRRVGVQRNAQDKANIFLLDSARMSRFTFDPSGGSRPIWSPDGSRVVFDSNRNGAPDLYEKPSNGAGSEKLLVESPQQKIADDWSPDGRYLLYDSADPKTDRDLWVLPLYGDRKPFVFLNTRFFESYGQFSPDGRWVAYQSNESGHFEIYVRPFPPEPGGQWQVSTSGGIQARWRHDGKELYYISPDGKLIAVPIMVNGLTLEPGTPVTLFQTRVRGGGTSAIRQQYDVASDGRFLLNVELEDTASPITLLLNWHPERGK